jgi:hypothetical protein
MCPGRAEAALPSDVCCEVVEEPNAEKLLYASEAPPYADAEGFV